MATQTFTVKVIKGRVRQFKKIVASTGFAEIATNPVAKPGDTKPLASNIVKVKHRRGEKPSDIFNRIGPIKMNVSDPDELRKGWDRKFD